MVGLAYDFVANPLGAVRLSFEKAASSSPSGTDPATAFRGKDWGAADLFREFLFDQGGLSQVPILDALTLPRIQPNTLVRFRGMVQDMLGNELYAGAFKDGSTWRTNKFSDVASFPIPPSCEPQLWERQLFHCIPIPGRNSWTLEASPSLLAKDDMNSPSQQGEKRRRTMEVDDMNFNDSHNAAGDCSPSTKKQKEDEHACQSCHSSRGLMSHASFSEQADCPNVNESSFSCLVKIYDVPESNLKLNDVYEFIGVYTFNPELSGHNDEPDDPMYDLFEDPMAQLPPTKVPRIHCLIHQKLNAQDFLPNSLNYEPLPEIIRGIRESLLAYLTTILGGDGLAAQFVLLHLLSRVRARVDTITVGKLSLNLIGLTRESSSIFGKQVAAAIQNLLPFTKAIPLTIDYLNNAKMQPRKDNKTGRLVGGVLQLPQGTHLTVDETHMQTGMLNSNGVESARLLKHLMEWQMVEYDFEYYKLEMAADIQVLVLSEGKSNILPADLALPLCPATVASTSVSTDELRAWRWYLATLKSLPQSSEPEMSQMIQNEMVAAMKEDRSLGSNDLSRWLTMAELMASSFGEKNLSREHWQMVKELERLRNERLKL